MHQQTIVVEGFQNTGDGPDLSDVAAIEFALDQRAFGRERLVVAGTDRRGTLVGLVHCPMTDPVETSFECCLDQLRDFGAEAAVAYSDEPVEKGSITAELRNRFGRTRAIAAVFGIHLVDWIQCGDTRIQSLKFGSSEDATWWDVPGAERPGTGLVDCVFTLVGLALAPD